MIDDSNKKAVKKGLKTRLPIMLSGVIESPHHRKTGQASKLIKSCIVRKSTIQEVAFFLQVIIDWYQLQ
jgi:hypothetical protein